MRPREDLDSIDQYARNLVDVRDGISRCAGGEPAAVQQGQRAYRFQAAKIDRGRTGCTVIRPGRLVRDDLRQVVQQIFDARGALEYELLGVDLGNRAGADQVALLDARAGDDDFLDGVDLGTLAGLSGYTNRRRKKQGRNDGCGDAWPKRERRWIDRAHPALLEALSST